METVTVLSRVVQTLLLGLFLVVPVLNSVQVGTPSLIIAIRTPSPSGIGTAGLLVATL